LDWVSPVDFDTYITKSIRSLDSEPLGEDDAFEPFAPLHGYRFDSQAEAATRILRDNLNGHRAHEVAARIVEGLTDSARSFNQWQSAILLRLYPALGQHGSMSGFLCPHADEDRKLDASVAASSDAILLRQDVGRPLIHEAINQIRDIRGKDAVERLLNHANATVRECAQNELAAIAQAEALTAQSESFNARREAERRRTMAEHLDKRRQELKRAADRIKTTARDSDNQERSNDTQRPPSPPNEKGRSDLIWLATLLIAGGAVVLLTVKRLGGHR
jgi:hypothetical protein